MYGQEERDRRAQESDERAECGSTQEKDERAEWGNAPQEWEELRREAAGRAHRTGSTLGWALAAFVVLTFAVSLLIQLAAVRASGLGRAGQIFSDLVGADWFGLGGITLVTYLLILPVVFGIMNRVPQARAEKKKMHFWKFCMFFVLIQGGGSLFNYLGNFINWLAGSYLNRGLEEMNPVVSVMNEMGFLTVAYTAVLGPLAEEYIFRWKVLNRLRPFGDRSAILYSALMFGLVHGNITQFLYAFAIGTVLGYIALKTGRLLYCCLLHILVNSWSLVLAFSAVHGSLLAVILLWLMILSIVPFILGAILIFCLKAGKVRLSRGGLPEGVRERDIAPALYLNAGTLTFAVLCVGMMAYYLLGA